MKKDLEHILTQLQQEFKRTFRENLISLMVYGSAAAGDYLPGQSDINLLAVVDRLDLQVLDLARRLAQALSRQGVTTPLLMTRAHIQTGTDVFPIEFLEIQEKHRMLWGEDLFAGIQIDTRNLRHECEHELKGRLLRLRQSYMEVGANLKQLRDVFLAAHQANFPAFRTALRLRGETPPLKKEEVVTMLSERFGLNKELFFKIKLLRQGELKLTQPALRALLDQYLDEVEKVAAAVDRM